jgi:hypothetical protein
MFRQDCLDDSEPLEMERDCFDCGRPIRSGTRCATCWILDDGAGYDEGGES